MRITITAITERGRLGLLQDLKERKKAPLHERLLFDRLFNLVVSWDAEKQPIAITLTSRTSFTDRVRPELYKEQFIKGFSSIGCAENEDYYYKIEEVKP